MLLLGLGVDLLEDGREVGHVLLGLGPLLLGQHLLLQAELRRPPDPVDAVVALLGREPAQRLENGFVFFDEEVVGPVFCGGLVWAVGFADLGGDLGGGQLVKSGAIGVGG